MLCCDTYHDLGCFYLCDSCLDVGLVADQDGAYVIEIAQTNGAVKLFSKSYLIGDSILLPVNALNNSALHYLRIRKPDLSYYEFAEDVFCAKFKTKISVTIAPTACDVVSNCSVELVYPYPLLFNFMPEQDIDITLNYSFINAVDCQQDIHVENVSTAEFNAVVTINSQESFDVQITPVSFPVAEGSYVIPITIIDCCGNELVSEVTIVVGCAANMALFSATLQNNAGVVYNSGDENYASWAGIFPFPPYYDCEARSADYDTKDANDFTDYVENVIIPYLSYFSGIGIISNINYSIIGSYPDEIFTVSYNIDLSIYFNIIGYYPCNKPLVSCEGGNGGSTPFTYLPTLECCPINFCTPPDITQYEGINPINNQTGWAYQHSFVLSGYENCQSEPLIQVTQNYGLNVVTSFWNGNDGYDGFTVDISENGYLPDGDYDVQITIVDCCGNPHIYNLTLTLLTCVTGTTNWVDNTVYISLSQLDQPFINQFNFVGYSSCVSDVWVQAFPNYKFVTYDNITIDPSNTFFTVEFSAHSGVQIGEVYTMTFNVVDCCGNFTTESFNLEITA